MLVMDETLGQDNPNVNKAIVKVTVKETNNRCKSNKCNQCKYSTFKASRLNRHLKTHSGEKLSKCNQCDYVCFQASNLKTHLKTHSGEKSNKCNQCVFACSRPSSLKRHMKRHAQTGERKKLLVISQLKQILQGLAFIKAQKILRERSKIYEIYIKFSRPENTQQTHRHRRNGII